VSEGMPESECFLQVIIYINGAAAALLILLLRGSIHP